MKKRDRQCEKTRRKPKKAAVCESVQFYSHGRVMVIGDTCNFKDIISSLSHVRQWRLVHYFGWTNRADKESIR